MPVNAAGIIQGATLRPEELEFETFERMFRINLLGTHGACVAFGRRMAVRRRGSILNLASIAGMRSTPLHAYGPMKAAVIRLTENLATEWGRSGVRVDCLSDEASAITGVNLAVDHGWLVANSWAWFGGCGKRNEKRPVAGPAFALRAAGSEVVAQARFVGSGLLVGRRGRAVQRERGAAAVADLGQRGEHRRALAQVVHVAQAQLLAGRTRAAGRRRTPAP